MNQTYSGRPVDIARCQSARSSWASALWQGGRAFLHLRYVRAVVAGVCLVAIAGSAAALTLALRHDVSAVAVFRYFVRPHSDEADLGRYFRSAATAIHLEPFLLLSPGVSSGGLVYAQEHGLVFYAHSPRGHKQLRQAKQVKNDLFHELTPLYWRADLENLVRELNKPSVRRQLIDAGASIRDLYALQRANTSPLDPRGRTHLLRLAARQLQFFAPYIPEPYQLTFGDELRFYDAQLPEGEYVGRWEIAPASLFASIDADYAHEMSNNNHYIVISRVGPEDTLVSDFYEASGATIWSSPSAILRAGPSTGSPPAPRPRASSDRAHIDDDQLELLVGDRRVAALRRHVDASGVVGMGRRAALLEELHQRGVRLAAHELVVVQLLAQPWHALAVGSVTGRTRLAVLGLALRHLVGAATTASATAGGGDEADDGDQRQGRQAQRRSSHCSIAKHDSLSSSAS